MKESRMKPRITHNLPADEYDLLPGIRSSQLKLMHYSPKRFISNDTGDDSSSRRGLRLIHTMTFEPEQFSRDYVVCDARSNSTEYKDVKAANPGKTVVTKKQLAEAQRVAVSVREHDGIRPLLEIGDPEVTCEWVDESTGLLCKCRWDWIEVRKDKVVICDLKTYGSVVEDDVNRRIRSRHAHVQAAHYCDGAAAMWPGKPIEFWLLVAEGGPHYDAAAMQLHDDGWLWIGRHQRSEWMTDIEACKNFNHWPGRHPEPITLDAPSHAFPDDITVED